MKRLPLSLLIIGLVICFGAPFAGLLATVVSMVMAFHDLGQSGISDPQALSNHIGGVLTGTVGGLVVSLAVGLPMIIAGIVVHLVTRKPTGAPAAS